MLSKELVGAAVRGHALGEARARQARLAELKNLTPARSRAIFTELWNAWAVSGRNNRPVNDEPKLKHLLRRRQSLDSLIRRPLGQ